MAYSMRSRNASRISSSGVIPKKLFWSFRPIVFAWVGFSFHVKNTAATTFDVQLGEAAQRCVTRSPVPCGQRDQVTGGGYPRGVPHEPAAGEDKFGRTDVAQHFQVVVRIAQVAVSRIRTRPNL